MGKLNKESFCCEQMYFEFCNEFVANSEGIWEMLDVGQILYCPWCGKKLEEVCPAK